MILVVFWSLDWYKLNLLSWKRLELLFITFGLIVKVVNGLSVDQMGELIDQPIRWLSQA